MFEKFVSIAALGIVALGSSLAWAGDDARSSIHISANIPNKQFHVQPRNPDFGKDEVMHFNPVNRMLSPVRQIFDVKNTDGSVHAYIEGNSWLFNGTYGIHTVTMFNNVWLEKVPKEVVDDATSTPGMTAEMRIFVPLPVSPMLSGLFTGHITVIFDAVPRVNS
ncbi:hypothetical protein SAMN03159488_00364 [Pseudomonas sp. NFIX10]|uniref:adhesin n=1 Tax=unclassified Pseudomonas TaxID=196821 RepID=UPI0008E434B4|nr:MULTISPECIES: adhesin [unclassified Pseudomonas]SFA77955.1 hypothetical protein SAMN03159488_00364 [Pseudomonas sp. NFIX10]SFE12805.1 hypothetical protein SAMN03159367_00364 [Pseudomonas sp. NFACC06-1]